MTLRQRVLAFASNVEHYCSINTSFLEKNEPPSFFPAGSDSDQHPIVIELMRRELILLRLEITSMKTDTPLLARLFWVDEVISTFASLIAKFLGRPDNIPDGTSSDADLQQTANAVIADNKFIRRIRNRIDFDNLFDAIVVDKYIDPVLLTVIPRTAEFIPVSVEIIIDMTTGVCTWRKAFSTATDIATRPVFCVTDAHPDVNERVWISFLRPDSPNLDLVFKKIPRARMQRWVNPVNERRWYLCVVPPPPAPESAAPAVPAAPADMPPAKRVCGEM